MRILALLLAFAPALARAYDCRANIRAAVCVAAPVVKPAGPEDFRCVSGGEEYVRELERVHDELPGELQRMFCHIGRIYVVDGLPSTALSIFEPQGHVLALNKALVFGGQSLNEWLQRKDQNAFRFAYEAELAPKVPKLEISLRTKAREQLMLIFIHEFAHLIDHANQFQRYWAKLSWLPSGAIRPEDRFAPRPPCFYDCLPQETWDPADADAYYRKFLRTGGFVSLYAAVDPSEDFAETLTYFYAEKLYGLQATLRFADGTTARLDGRRRKKLAEKFDFVKALSILPWEYGAHNLCAEPDARDEKADAPVEGCPGRR